MKNFQIQSITRILVLVVVGATLLCTQIPSLRKLSAELFLFEVCMLLLYILASLISWKRYF
jgi:hypothetical protein